MSFKKSISGDTNPDAYLTNYSYGLMQEDGVFVAGAASSRIPVTQEAGKFNVYPPGAPSRSATVSRKIPMSPRNGRLNTSSTIAPARTRACKAASTRTPLAC